MRAVRWRRKSVRFLDDGTQNYGGEMALDVGKGVLIQRWALRFFWVLLLLQIFKYAWLTEDAFINFRVIDQLLAGHGPVWNSGERVQVFTSPLWLLLTAGLAAASGELMYTTLWASACLALIFFLALRRVSGGGTLLFLLAAMACVLSTSLRDYFTSGLETPLLMAVLGWFCVSVARGQETTWRRLCFMATLCVLVRHDTALLVAPFVIQRGWHMLVDAGRPALRFVVRDGLLGSAPFWLWSLFSTIYYGAPLPNTAAAKVVQGFDGPAQAWHYFVYMQGFDPIAYPLICLAVVVSFTTRSSQAWPLLAALVTFALYLFQVGADYMAGRFLVGPMVVSVMLLVHAARQALQLAQPDWPLWAKNGALATAVAMFGFQVLLMPNASAYKPPRPPFVQGVADERHHYHGSTDLMTLLTEGPQHRYLETARLISHSRQPIYISCNIGMLGYYSPMEAHIVDPLALTDRFLAGLPVRPGPIRIGHFERLVPREYVASLVLGRNVIGDPVLHAYFDDVQWAIKGELFATSRWQAIWRLNSGYYRRALAGVTPQSGGGALRMATLPTRPDVMPPSCLGSGGGAMVPEFREGDWALRMLDARDGLPGAAQLAKTHVAAPR